MQAVIPLMRAQGGGSIVNINSGTAFMTVLQYSVYSSSKRALLGFSLAARAELEKDRIVVSEIYPFITATNFGKNRMGNSAGSGPSTNYAEGDKPEFVAGLVPQAIQSHHAANRVTARSSRDREGISKTGAACLEVQTMQRNSPTGVTQAASRVFNAE